jgi:hypothetical protein
MRDKITRLCGQLLKAEEPDAQPVAAELQQAIRDRIETVRQDFVDIALIDRIMELECISTAPRDETSS